MLVETGNIYPGLCCTGYDFEVALIFPDSIWGTCRNPACTGRDGRGTDHFQGVSNWSQEDFEELVSEAVGPPPGYLT